MAMKKTSGGDSPLRQGAGKSFWTLPIFGSTAAADRDVFWKSDRVLRFFSSGGTYRRKGAVRGGATWPHTGLARPGARPRRPCVWGPRGPPPSGLRMFGSSPVKYDFWNLFRPIPRIFPVHHFWHFVNRLVPENV